MKPSSRPTWPQRGFTLIELMVVVAVLAIAVSIVAPSFRAFLQGQQVKGLAYDLTTDLFLARSEALKRNASVSIARSGSSWDSGWVTRAVASADALARRNASAQSVTVSGAPAAIIFDVNGRVSSPSTQVRITISSSSISRCVELDLSGRARSSVGVCT